MSENILVMNDVNKKYPGVQALKNCNFELEKGQVHVIVGENGAGKSTLVKILSGAIKPDSGSIYIKGKKVDLTPKNAVTHGVGIVYQEAILVEDLTVSENIFLGNELLSPFTKTLKDEKMCEVTKEILSKLEVDLDYNKKIKDLSLAEKHYVQLSRVMLYEPDIIILDELTSALTDIETEKIFAIIENLKAMGKSIIYVTHFLEEVCKIGDVVTVLKDGEVNRVEKVETVNLSSLVGMMLGEDIKDHYPKLPVEIGDEVLRVNNLSSKVVKDINFSLFEGEVIGVTGLVGSGKTNLVKTLLGLEEKKSGDIYINGIKAVHNKTKDFIKNGIGYISENRDTNGLFFVLSVATNITISNLDYLSKNKIISLKKEKKVVRDIVRRLNIKISDINQKTIYLSGGNKQKVILARSLMSRANIFIFDEPTRGVDISGKVEIYNLMNELVRRGAAIIMVSSDFSEIAGMSNRILVMNEGKIAAELTRKEATQNEIYKYISEH